MEGAKRTAESMDKTSSFTDNDNNVQNATEIHAGAPTGSSSGLRIYDSFVPILLPSLTFYRTLGLYSNISPSRQNTTGNSSGINPALGSSSNQTASTEGSLASMLTPENEERHSKKICLENGDGEGFQPLNLANDMIPISNYLPELEPTTAAAGSSSSAGNSTSSTVENPPPVAVIEFGGRIIPATPVQLVPVMNPEPRPSAFSVPPTPQSMNAPGAVRVYSGFMDFTTFMSMKSRQYAERAYYTSPTIMAPLQAELHMQMFRHNMMLRHAGASTSRENDDAEDGDDEDDWDSDDTFDTDTDDDDDDDDIDDILGIEEDEDVAPGLTEEQIVNAMKTEKYKANTTTTDGCCPICWEEYKDGEVIGRLDCEHNHKFHVDCIKSWLRKQNSCPLCRMNGLVL